MHTSFAQRLKIPSKATNLGDTIRVVCIICNFRKINNSYFNEITAKIKSLNCLLLSERRKTNQDDYKNYQQISTLYSQTGGLICNTVFQLKY